MRENLMFKIHIYFRIILCYLKWFMRTLWDQHSRILVQLFAVVAKSFDFCSKQGSGTPFDLQETKLNPSSKTLHRLHMIRRTTRVQKQRRNKFRWRSTQSLIAAEGRRPRVDAAAGPRARGRGHRRERGVRWRGALHARFWPGREESAAESEARQRREASHCHHRRGLERQGSIGEEGSQEAKPRALAVRFNESSSPRAEGSLSISEEAEPTAPSVRSKGKGIAAGGVQGLACTPRAPHFLPTH